MGFRSKRLAKEIPELVEELEVLRTSVATTAATSELDGDRMRGVEQMGRALDAKIDQGNVYLAEYDVSNRKAVDFWVKSAAATLTARRPNGRSSRPYVDPRRP